MKTKIAVNIDTVDFSVNGENGSFVIPNTNFVNLISADGEILNNYQNRVSIPGKFGPHKLNVRALNSGTRLEVQGSPYANLCGQNVYTSSDLRTGVLSALRKVCKELRIKPTKEQKEKWIAGDIDLQRVDLAVNYRFASEAMCLEVLRQVRRQLEEQGGSTRTSGTTIYWTPKNGAEYSISFYAKGPQMRRQKCHDELPSKLEFLEECSCILRIEIRLRAEALRLLKLDKVSNWTEDSAAIAFWKYMRRLRLLSVTSGPVTQEELDALPHRRLRPVLALHKAGIPLEQVYSSATLQRHRADFRKQGIDLRCPNQTTREPIPLNRVLSPKRAIKSASAWMHEKGLVPPS